MSRRSSTTLIQRAVAWWVARRPEGWNESDHLASPTVNCATSLEAALANSAANVVRSRQGVPCPRCKNLATCTCMIEREHKKGCRYRRAACLSIELACDHGLQACPKCDPCTCGALDPVRAVL